MNLGVVWPEHSVDVGLCLFCKLSMLSMKNSEAGTRTLPRELERCKQMILMQLPGLFCVLGLP